MKLCTVFVSLLACAMWAPTASADQCAWVSNRVARRAAHIVERHKIVVSYCEPCGDPGPDVPHAVADVAVRPVGGASAELAIDGRGVDLAYTYVMTSAESYRNLARMAGCPATGVSTRLHLSLGRGTGVSAPPATGQPPSGAEINPPPVQFAQPPPPRCELAPAPPAPPGPPAAAAAQAKISVRVAAAPPPWILALLACLGMLIGGFGLALFALGARRRRPPAGRAELDRLGRLADGLTAPAAGADVPPRRGEGDVSGK